jgi:hypothetical protein
MASRDVDQAPHMASRDVDQSPHMASRDVGQAHNHTTTYDNQT